MTSRQCYREVLPPPTRPEEPSDRQYSALLAVGEHEFDQEIKTLDVRELLGLIACLQREMALEQRHFDRLNVQFQNRKSGFQGPKQEEEAVELSAALCRSQIRLAQLCNRNMRCFTQQAARAQQDRSTEAVKKVSSPSSPVVGSRDKIGQNKSDWRTNNNNFEKERDGENDCVDVNAEEDVRVYWKRAPSVEDILQTVRSMRSIKDEVEEKPDVERKLNGVTPNVSFNGRGNVEVKRFTNNTSNKNVNGDTSGDTLVPTATQLLLRMKPVKPQQSLSQEENNGKEDTEIEKMIEKDNDSFRKRNKVRKSIFQQNMFGTQEIDRKPSFTEDEPPPPPPVIEQVDSDASDSLPPPPSPLPPTDDTPNIAETSFSEEAEDRFLDGYTNGSGGHTATFPYLEEQQLRLENYENSKPVVNRRATDDEEAAVPSIIDQFIEEPPKQNKCRRTDVHWNVDDLVEHLYVLPQPKPPALPPAAYINMEGYLEMLPVGRRQGTFWNAWKRRYFKLKDGYLFCYQSSKTEEPVLCLQLMGGRIDIVESQILVDDGKGHCIMLRCNNRTETEKWRRALLTHTAENYMLTYAQPVVPYPQFYEKVIIVDIGSCSVRGGILCNQPTLPQVYFPTVCAEEKLTGYRVYGKEALSPKIRFDSTVTFPLRPSAKITKFTVDMVAVKGILTKVFEDLNVDPAEYEVQLSLPRSFPFKSQTDVLDLLMTEFGIQGVNLMAQTVLALCSYNTTSGVVVDVGERLEVVPIVDGYVIESGVSRIPYGGSRLMDHLRHFLMQRHYGLSSITESFLLRYVLENSCYCALNYKTELQNFLSQPQNFEMSIPVGHFFQRDEAPWESITVDGGRFQAPEGLFRPEAWGLDNAGIHKLVWKAIQDCSVDVRKEMSRGIYLSGGVTMLPGFAERLQSEMERLTPPTVQPKVHASPYRAHAAYLGACNWALSAGFHEAKITRNEWIANGSGCLKKWHF